MPARHSIFGLAIIIIVNISLVHSSIPLVHEELYHQRPQNILVGEDARFELDTQIADYRVTRATLFYRLPGHNDFEALEMESNGMIYDAEIPAERLAPGAIEYYFAFETSIGRRMHLPNTNPWEQPFETRVVAAEKAQQTLPVEVLLLSPQPDEIIPSDEFLLALSLPISPQKADQYRYRLLIRGIDVSRFLKRDGNLITFAPQTIRSGAHQGEFQVYNRDGQMVGKKAFNFRISGQPTSQKGFNYQSNVYFDNRYQNINEVGDNYYRGGFNFIGSFKKLDFNARGLLSSEDSYDRQPVNQFGVGLSYNFNSSTNAYMKAGDFYTSYDPLVLWERRIRGVSAGFESPYVDLDITYGQTASSVEGAVEQELRTITDPVTNDSITTDTLQSIRQYGTYKKQFLAVRPQFKFGSHVNWALNLVNSKDDPNSIQYGANPKEALVAGTTLRLNFHQNRVIFLSSFQASMKNEDASGEIAFDTLATKFDLSGDDRDTAERLYNLLDDTGFLSLSPGLSPLPSLAMQFETRLRYFNQNLRVSYKKIDGDYTTPGNPYLLKDIEGIFLYDDIRLINNQVYLNLFYKNFRDNLSNDFARTKNSDIGGSISYFPFRNLPSITLSYAHEQRESDGERAIADTTGIYKKDITTQRIGLSSSYRFETGAVQNVATFSATNYEMDDAINPVNESRFTIFTLGMRNQFSIPLKTKLSYGQTGSSFGESDTDIRKIKFGLSYSFPQLLWQSDLEPFVDINHQQISTDPAFGETSDYQRINYSAGLNLRRLAFGNFSLRYDYISFNLDENSNRATSDMIVTTRFDFNL